MSSPKCHPLSALRRMLSRRLATGTFVLCLVGAFTLMHFALIEVEKTRDLNALSFRNSTIEKLFQRLMISDQVLCGNACATESDSGTLKENGGDAPSPLSKEGYDDDETEIAILLPERDEVSHPEQYQKDVAKRLSSTWTEEMSETQKDLFHQRSSAVQERCGNMELTGALSPKLGMVYENMRWITKHNMIWCPIFKAASTTWVKNLLMIAGESKIHEKSLHARVRQLYGKPEDPKVRDKLLKEFQKMLIVRHPLERLLSAYRDKMLRVRHANDPHVRIQQAILLKYPDPNAPPSTTVKTSTKQKKKKKLPTEHPSFTQFLMKVRDDLKSTWADKGKTIVNMHWRPYWLSCAPCHIPYDFIAKVETLDLDQEYIIRQMGLQDLLYNARTHSSNFDSYNKTTDAAKDYFRQVPVSLLKDIVELYSPDFTLFDYSPQPYLKMAKPDA